MCETWLIVGWSSSRTKLSCKCVCKTCLEQYSYVCHDSGRHRYICRKHVWYCITKLSESKCLQDRNTKCQRWWVLWKGCWTNARQTFRQKRVGIVQDNIDALLEDLDLECQSWPSTGQDFDSTSGSDKTFGTKNTVVVKKTAQQQLVQACQEGGAERYALELSAMGWSRTTSRVWFCNKPYQSLFFILLIWFTALMHPPGRAWVPWLLWSRPIFFRLCEMVFRFPSDCVWCRPVHTSVKAWKIRIYPKCILPFFSFIFGAFSFACIRCIFILSLYEGMWLLLWKRITNK